MIIIMMINQLGNHTINQSMDWKIKPTPCTYIRWYYSEHVAHAWRKISLRRKKPLIKCLEQVKQQRLLLMCAHISELPSYKNTMRHEPTINNNWLLSDATGTRANIRYCRQYCIHCCYSYLCLSSRVQLYSTQRYRMLLDKYQRQDIVSV